MSRNKQRKLRNPAARKARKAAKRRAVMRRRNRGKRETPRGLRTRGQMRQPMPIATPTLNVMDWLQDRRHHRRQKVA